MPHPAMLRLGMFLQHNISQTNKLNGKQWWWLLAILTNGGKSFWFYWVAEWRSCGECGRTLDDNCSQQKSPSKEKERRWRQRRRFSEPLAMGFLSLLESFYTKGGSSFTMVLKEHVIPLPCSIHTSSEPISTAMDLAFPSRTSYASLAPTPERTRTANSSALSSSVFVLTPKCWQSQCKRYRLGARDETGIHHLLSTQAGR